jgi:hypothetical protein
MKTRNKIFQKHFLTTKHIKGGNTMNIRQNLFVVGVAVILLIAPYPSKAQIPNPGFEQWTSGQPDGWFAINLPGETNSIIPSTTSHSGTFALCGQVVQNMAGLLSPVVISGSDGRGFKVSQRHAALKGFYKLAPVGGDVIFINVLMMWDGVGIGIGNAFIPLEASSYTPFTIGIAYTSYQTPDSCIISILMFNPVVSINCHVGSTMLIDDLSFAEGGTSVSESGSNKTQIPERFTLFQSYPNPFNSSCVIEYAIPEPSDVMIKVYDVRGEEATTLFCGVNATGFYKVHFQPDRLQSGLYFYRITAVSRTSGKTFTETKKTMFVK